MSRFYIPVNLSQLHTKGKRDLRDDGLVRTGVGSKVGEGRDETSLLNISTSLGGREA